MTAEAVDPTPLTTTQVAAMFGVHPVTIARWDRQGLIPAGVMFRTPGGHRRFWPDKVHLLLSGGAS